MKKLRLLFLLPLLLLTSCARDIYDIYYHYNVPEYAVVIYGTVTDKDAWTVTENSRIILSNDTFVYHYFALYVHPEGKEYSYFIQVDQVTYDSVEVGDEIAIPYIGETL